MYKIDQPPDECYHIRSEDIIKKQFYRWILGIVVACTIQFLAGIIALLSTYEPVTAANIIGSSASTGFVILIAIFAMVFIANGNNRFSYIIGALLVISLQINHLIPMKSIIPGVLSVAPLMIILLSILNLTRLYIDLHPHTWYNYHCDDDDRHRRSYLTYAGALVIGVLMIILL